ncbi:nucleotidyltransferase domain-containing protein [Clostridium sardiniense]|uniref:nucleotidyltransferase domain-containing protein n=1 Tax=Clostridium sardiniense TaxID=29369 RepID=UPI003D32808A
MNSTEKGIINVLNHTIRGEKIYGRDLINIDWNKFIDKASEHSISGLLYSSISWNGREDIDKSLVNDWRRNTFYTGVNQLKHINQVEKIIKKFNEEKVRVIVLKGLVIREFYKNPELRTMCDADILVYEEDLDKARNILISLGYLESEEYDEHGAHIVFEHTSHLPVEVHWTLINDDYFSGSKEFEKTVWENTMKVKIGDTEALSLGWEDLALHLCVHMAVHIVHRGFGIRQLVDLVVLIENKGKYINWNEFRRKSIECKVNKFVIIIFNVCKELFNMEIPFEVNDGYEVDKGFLNNFIEEIIESGIYGHGDLARSFGNDISGSEENNSRKFLSLLFPAIEDMNSKYNYAKKYKILLPIAWIHHLLSGIFNKEYSLLDKLKFMTLTVKKSNNKTKIIRWLELE